MIGIGIADDHDLMRIGIKKVLEAEPDFKVVLEAEDGKALLSHQRLSDVEVLLLDLRMPNMNGLQVVQHLHVQYPVMRILVVSSMNEPFQTQSLYNLGVKGYLLKSSATADRLPEVIRKIHDGQLYYTPELLTKKLQFEQHPDLSKAMSFLTNLHMEVIKLSVQGLTEEQIADRLHMTRINVSKMKQRINESFGKNTFQETVAYCIEHQLVEPGQ